MKSYQIKNILSTLCDRLLILLVKKVMPHWAREKKKIKPAIITYCPSMSHVHFVLYL